jgi:hypothetical protein
MRDVQQFRLLWRYGGHTRREFSLRLRFHIAQSSRHKQEWPSILQLRIGKVWILRVGRWIDEHRVASQRLLDPWVVTCTSDQECRKGSYLMMLT